MEVPTITLFTSGALVLIAAAVLLYALIRGIIDLLP